MSKTKYMSTARITIPDLIETYLNIDKNSFFQKEFHISFSPYGFSFYEMQMAIESREVI